MTQPVFDVLIRAWNPTCGKGGHIEEPANTEPLTEQEADAMVEELTPCVDVDYHGQGQTLHSVRKLQRHP